MSKKQPKANAPKQPPVVSLLDLMVEGKEYESLLSLKEVNVDIGGEIRRAMDEIEAVRGRKNIIYAGNIVRPTAEASINSNDDLPFKEMIDNFSSEIKDIDIILITNGGLGEQVTKFVDALRPRFTSVEFILPSSCMSAGTLWALSGDEILMDSRAVIGPIDPQIPGPDGRYLPAQSLLTLVKTIQDTGAQSIADGNNIPWSLIQLLNGIGKLELGSVINMTKYGETWAAQYLENYKFRTWITHSSTQCPVTKEEKRSRAEKIAHLLATNESWNSHGHGITRDVAWEKLNLKIKQPEATPGLQRALRRLWALLYYSFERTPLVKVIISSDCGVFFHSTPTPGGQK
jgi:hypothetical protein